VQLLFSEREIGILEEVLVLMEQVLED